MMATRWKGLLMVAIAGLVSVAGLAWWVLESSGVAIAETRSADGAIRRTHVWYAETEDGIWLEAGRPDHPWYLDVQRDPRLVLRADGRSGEYEAATVAGQAAHEHVRALLREKYGLRDRILDSVIDTSTSIAVRLTPVAGTVTAPRDP
jgi:hypothetical protein